MISLVEEQSCFQFGDCKIAPSPAGRLLGLHFKALLFVEGAKLTPTDSVLFLHLKQVLHVLNFRSLLFGAERLGVLSVV